MQSRSTHSTQASPSPFTGLTGGRKTSSQGKNGGNHVNGGRNSIPRISGPFPSQAAINAVNAAVSPKQQRSAAMHGPNGNNNTVGAPDNCHDIVSCNS
jgi:hypothetical protein